MVNVNYVFYFYGNQTQCKIETTWENDTMTGKHTGLIICKRIYNQTMRFNQFVN